jgi:hypothetical protein
VIEGGGAREKELGGVGKAGGEGDAADAEVYECARDGVRVVGRVSVLSPVTSEYWTADREAGLASLLRQLDSRSAGL